MAIITIFGVFVAIITIFGVFEFSFTKIFEDDIEAYVLMFFNLVQDAVLTLFSSETVAMK